LGFFIYLKIIENKPCFLSLESVVLLT